MRVSLNYKMCKEFIYQDLPNRQQIRDRILWIIFHIRVL
jgi:hypothetical protein